MLEFLPAYVFQRESIMSLEQVFYLSQSLASIAVVGSPRIADYSQRRTRACMAKRYGRRSHHDPRRSDPVTARESFRVPERRRFIPAAQGRYAGPSRFRQLLRGASART